MTKTPRPFGSGPVFLALCGALLAGGCGEVVESQEGDGGAGDGAPDAAGGEALPRLSASAAIVREGDTVGGAAIFQVTLSHASAREVTFDFSTADGSATESDADYEPVAGAVALSPGETEATVEVRVLGDFRSEADESFRLVLENPTGAVLESAEATATVEDDDRGFDFNGDGLADLMVGAQSAGETGEVYIFFGAADHEPGGQTEVLRAGDADVLLTGALASFGRSLAGGDVNGDGFDDVFVADSKIDGGVETRAVFGFFGSASPDSTIRAGEADVSIEGAGTQVDLADIDGDRLADLLLGGTGEGHVFAGAGLAGQMSAEDATATFVGDDDFLEFRPAGAGDFDGDGAEDFLWALSSATDKEGAFLFLGGESPSGVIGVAGADVDMRVNAGKTILGAGDFDVNQDGLGDVVLASPAHNVSDGSVQIYLGRAEPSEVLDPDVSILGELDSERFGASVAAAGDLDGDGLGDLVAGLPTLDAPDAVNGGTALVYLGRNDPPPDLSMFAQDLEIAAEGGGDLLSVDLAVLDFNGDGFHDLALAAPGAEHGKVYLFLGFEGGFRSASPVSAGDADVIVSADVAIPSFASVLGD